MAAQDRSRRPASVPPPATGTARFTKAHRLRRRADFLRVQAQGERRHTRHFGVTLGPPGPSTRLGLVITRRLGNAVQRNRLKRLLREFFRRHRAWLPPRDLVILAKAGAGSLSYLQVQEELARLLGLRQKDAELD